MAVDFMLTAAPVISQRELERRFEAGVRFLQSEQNSGESPCVGAWPSSAMRGASGHTDWNTFTTALTSTACAAIEHALPPNGTPIREPLAAMQVAAAGFLHTSTAASPEGSYRFWPSARHAMPGPDLDDTALAHLALRAVGDDAPGALECERLFGPYRLTSGARPHAASSWARGFPGVFGTWMNESEPIVDVCANANVMRLLQRCGAEHNAGYRAAAGMLAVFLNMQTLPIDVAPYYRSNSMLAWLCAQLDLPGATREEAALALALDERLKNADDTAPHFDDVLLVESARERRGIAPSLAARAHLFDSQSADGGWPPIVVCWNFPGTLRWTSRSFPTALALGLLLAARKSIATC